ncbi:MAG: phytanoyl-CoA dioxygenase family protein [Ardenticatenaceae bacterium]|nr:phytanoyl-CoA dioxygenase family protein [Ardenticatenaceae bacterium]
MSDLTAFFTDEQINVEDLAKICQQSTSLEDYPFAAGTAENIVIYRAERVQEALSDPQSEGALQAEWTRCLKDGPGVFVVKGAYPDLSVIDRTTAAFKKIIAQEKASGSGQGDHFGTNERVWNSLQKACLYDPELFVDYYKNPVLALACRAWLGPHYQMTAQVNNVKPGGTAQTAHRDYHLGFQSEATIQHFPAHVQHASQYLTLQGAIAHCDMPLESGPTLFLPYSQLYKPGYLAIRQEPFRQYFDQHRAQIPFGKGDMVFFSPALFHGAGNNQSHQDRMANLVQISSAFGRPMETINRLKMIEAVYPVLLRRKLDGSISNRECGDTVTSTADGYSFPTNLDSDPPLGGNAPETAAQMVHRALNESWSLEQLMAELKSYAKRRLA